MASPKALTVYMQGGETFRFDQVTDLIADRDMKCQLSFSYVSASRDVKCEAWFDTRMIAGFSVDAD